MVDSKNVLAGLVAASFFGAASSLAADIDTPKTYHPYIEFFGGLGILPGISGTDGLFFPGPVAGKVNSKVGDFAGIAVGAALKQNWRVEAELSRSYNGIENFTFNNGGVNTYDGGGVNQTYALANVWYDFRNQSAFVPYLGGGIGAGWANGSLDLGGGLSIDATSPVALAFQVGAGVVYDVNENFSIDVGYRFKAMTGLNPSVSPSAYSVDQNNIASHNFQIGAVLHF